MVHASKDSWAWLEFAMFLSYTAFVLGGIHRSSGWQRNLLISGATKANTVMFVAVWLLVMPVDLSTRLVIMLFAALALVLLEVQFSSWWFIHGLLPNPQQESVLANPKHFVLTQVLFIVLTITNMTLLWVAREAMFPPDLMLGGLCLFLVAVTLGLALRWYRIRRYSNRRIGEDTNR